MAASVIKLQKGVTVDIDMIDLIQQYNLREFGDDLSVQEILREALQLGLREMYNEAVDNF